MAHHFNTASLAWGSHNIRTPESKKTTAEENDNPKFSIMRPFEKGIATIAGGYYSASYIPDENGTAFSNLVASMSTSNIDRSPWSCSH